MKINKKLLSKKTVTNVSLVFMAVLIAAMSFIMTINNIKVHAVCNSISSCQEDKENYEREAAKLASQAKTLQSAVSELQYQASALEAQIGVTQAKYDDLKQQIFNTEKKITDNKDALGKTIAAMYVDDNISPLEMLASSSTIGEYMDKQEYRTSVRSGLSTIISSIKKLKSDLEAKKSEVELVLVDQRNARSELDRKNQEKQNLLDKTNGDEAAYQQLAADADAEMSRMLEAQKAWNTNLIDTYSDYSQIWNDSNCIMGSANNINIPGYYSWVGSDNNGGDGHSYGCRQCVSYAMWRVYKATGHYYENWGDPVHLASSADGIFNSGPTPKAGSLGIMSAAVAGNDGQGHVVWVESVNGGTLTVSQYNANVNGIGYGMYSKVNISASEFYKYIYIIN